MTDEVTAVIVNWRTADDSIRAARALVADGLPPERIVAVDSGSGDEDVRRLAGGLAGSRLIALPHNVGYARASNAGARVLPARRAYVFVNPDAWVSRPGSLAHLIDALDAPTTAVAVPRLLNPDLSLQPSVVPFLNPLSALVRSSGLSRFAPDRAQPVLGTYWSHDRTRRVQSATGAVLAVRADAWDALGGFDERRFMYVEDHDLCRRAHRAGWRMVFVAEAEFVHLGGASARRRWSSPQRARRVARAEAEMLHDHLDPLPRALTLALLAGGAAWRAVHRGMLGDRAGVRTQMAWLRGYLGADPPRRASTELDGH